MSDFDPSAREQASSLGLLAASLVSQRDDIAKATILHLKDAGVRRETLREIILQTYLHDGYATALDGMVLLQQVWPGAPEPTDATDYADWEEWEKRGRELFKMIYGDVADRVEKGAAETSPELSRWMLMEGYGKTLARGGVDTATRELATVAVLTIKRRPRQLFSHLRGAMRAGVHIDEIHHLLILISGRLSEPSGVFLARELLTKLSSRESMEI